jgi:hypothetical protein
VTGVHKCDLPIWYFFYYCIVYFLETVLKLLELQAGKLLLF